MATRTIDAKIALDGEKEFKQAISGINSGLKVLTSEMKKVTAEYQDNADSVEALKDRGDVLDRQLSSQKEKLEAVKKALENAAQGFGESDKRTMEWQKTLNDTEAAIADTEHAIKENNEALENATNGGNETSGMLDGLIEKFGDKLPSGVKDALSSIGGFSTGAVAAVGAVAAAVTALIATYKKLFELTKEQAAEAGEIEDLSQIMGLDVESVQEYQYAAELIGTSFDTIKGSMTKMKRNMQSAQEGNEDLTDSFKKLGVEVEDADGNLRDSEDVFWDIIESLGEVENVTERDTIAMDLLGKSAEDLNPLIEQGREAFEDYREEAEGLNTIMSEDTVSALAAVDDAYLRLQATQDGIKEQIAGEMAPAVETFYEAWMEFMTQAGETLIESGVIDNLALILENFSQLLSSIISAEEEVPVLTTVLEALSVALGAVAQFAALVADLVDALKSLATLDFSGFANALGFGYSSGNANNYQRTRMAQDGTLSQYTEFYASKNASGDYNFAGGYTWVGENGPEIVSLPQGSSISTAQESRNFGNTTYNITIDAKNVKEMNDVIRIAKNSRITARMRG